MRIRERFRKEGNKKERRKEGRIWTEVFVTPLPWAEATIPRVGCDSRQLELLGIRAFFCFLLG